MEKAKLLEAGNQYKNFELRRIVDLPEIHCYLRELTHLPTGARVFHIENDDEENVFCLSFQTTPKSSNGVAHILEHTVLCGSEKFPVKDPFFSMSRRSLNTFMNAFTGADFTCYPAASQVPKDFYNLLEVYLDAVFNPKLLELSFLQEGHRLEFSNGEDPASPLEYKGIVFNEMKGAMASPDSRLSDALDNALYPSLTYGYNSGGDPKVIPELTYQQLLDFHKTYYHPSRCIFFFYGNLPLEGHLDFVEKNALEGVEKKEYLPFIPLETRFKEKVRKEIGYPYSAEEDPSDKNLISFGWLTCHILDQETFLALNVLSTALLATDAAPLKKRLLKSGMCKQVLAYLQDDYSEIPLVITLKGCRKEDGDALEKLINDTLEEVVNTGISEELIENAIHQIEFQRSEITGDSLPYGLSLFLRAGLLKQHGGLPEDALLIHSLCSHLRKRYREDPLYFTTLLKKYLLENPHFARITAKPDLELAEKELKEEKERLAKICESFDLQEQEEVVAKAKELARFQEEQETANLDILPKISLKDVAKDPKDYPLLSEEMGPLQIFRHECFTNKILYADLVFPLPFLEERELPLLKLFTVLLPQIGCGGRSYAENLDYIQAHTGGVAASETLNIQVHDFEEFHPYFVLEGKALFRKADKLFALLKDMTTSASFSDISRVKEILVKHFSGLQNSLNKNALRYAINLAASGLGMPSRISSAWGGLEYYYAVKKIVENLDTKLPSLIEELEGLKKRLLGLENPHLVLSLDKEMYKALKSKHFFDLQDIGKNPYTPWKSQYSLTSVPFQGRVIASPVAFTSKVFKSLPYNHPDTAALNIAANLFDNLTLHPRIREQGGAYGGGATNNSLSGNFCFWAYRDPNICSTLSAFEESVEKLVNGDFKESDLEEAKLELIQGLDTPISPGIRANAAYSWLREGKTFQIRKTYRHHLLGLKKEEIIRAVSQHILPCHMNGSTVVFAGKQLLEKENDILISKGRPPLKIEKL